MLRRYLRSPCDLCSRRYLTKGDRSIVSCHNARHLVQHCRRLCHVFIVNDCSMILRRDKRTKVTFPTREARFFPTREPKLPRRDLSRNCLRHRDNCDSRSFKRANFTRYRRHHVHLVRLGHFLPTSSSERSQ